MIIITMKKMVTESRPYIRENVGQGSDDDDDAENGDFIPYIKYQIRRDNDNDDNEENDNDLYKNCVLYYRKENEQNVSRGSKWENGPDW